MKKLIILALVITTAFSLSACSAFDCQCQCGTGAGVASGTTDAPAAVTPPPRIAGTKVVGIINNPPSESGYREANVRDFESVFTEANGYQTTAFYSINNEQQLDRARQFIADGVEYLLISAAETAGWESVLRDAQAAGIKVFLFDRMIDVDHSLFEAAVVSDMRKQGEIAVDMLAGLRLDRYDIIHIQGAMDSDAQIGRTGPLNEAVEANANWNLVTQQTATWDEATAEGIVQDVIRSGARFNVIYAENDGMARGAANALIKGGISHGRDGNVVIIGFDCNTWALEELLAGNWNFNIQCSPFQAGPIHEMIQSGNIPSKIVISDERGFDANTITQADIDRYGI